jgi:hypothetical protein
MKINATAITKKYELSICFLEFHPITKIPPAIMMLKSSASVWKRR